MNMFVNKILTHFKYTYVEIFITIIVFLQYLHDHALLHISHKNIVNIFFSSAIFSENIHEFICGLFILLLLQMKTKVNICLNTTLQK